MSGLGGDGTEHRSRDRPASNGRGSAVEPSSACRAAGPVGERERRLGTGQPDGADRHPRPCLPMGEDVLDLERAADAAAIARSSFRTDCTERSRDQRLAFVGKRSSGPFPEASALGPSFGSLAVSLSFEIRSNGRSGEEDCPAAGGRNGTLRATRHCGRARRGHGPVLPWKRWSRWHTRSKIEAKM